jgi:predicted acetylornithine/succinylornithine family transaminase
MVSYKKIKNEYVKYIVNTYGVRPVSFVKGKGVYLYDTTGKAYLDFISGLAVNVLGYAHPAIVKAVNVQIKKLAHISNLFYNEVQPELAKILSLNSLKGRVFFCNSGAEANEAAIKLVRKYGRKFSPKRYEIITMFDSFHGRTMASLTATGQAKYRRGFSPMVAGFKYARFNDIADLKRKITSKTIAVMLEPIQGEGGVYPADKLYLREVKKLCQKKKIVLVFDEIQTGMGRTGNLFAYQGYKVTPDIITIAKGLGGGLPMGAIIAKKEIAQCLSPGTHASTFGGNPVVGAAAIVTLKVLLKRGFLKKVCLNSDYLKSQLKRFADTTNIVKEVRGKGMMLAVELNVPLAKNIVDRCLKEGLILNAIGDNILRFLPPLIIGRKDVDKMIRILGRVLKKIGTKHK